MRIATWNVNSLRSRIDRVERFLERHDVDVLALQETKAREDQLPLMGIQSLGYDIAVVRDQPVERGRDHQPGRASRTSRRTFPGQPGWGEPAEPESRAIGATCGGVRIWSLYIPNGRKPDDPHYVYKLDWLARLREAAGPWLGSDDGAGRRLERLPDRRRRLRRDQFRNSTHVTPPERAAFQAFLDDGYADVVRPHAPGPDVYTYWDYYRQRFERNRGLRIDFVLGSPSFASRVTGAFIDRDERDPAQGTGSPSDHAPVVVDLA